MVCGHSKLSSDRTNSILMDLSAKEEIFGGHKKKYYFDDPYLFKYCPDQLLRRCVANDDQIGVRLVKSCKLIFIWPLFLKIALTFAKPVLDANN